MIAPPVSKEAATALQALLSELCSDQITFDQAAKRLYEVAESSGWEWFGLGSKPRFNRCAQLFLVALCYETYSRRRTAQLEEREFSKWVFRADPDCRDEHGELDGLALPPDHPFWIDYNPPLGWECSCYVVGASSENGVLRLGGDPNKNPPGWIDSIDPGTGLRPGIDPPWGKRPLDVDELLSAIASGAIPA